MAKSDFDASGRKVADSYWDKREREMQNLINQEVRIEGFNRRLNTIYSIMINEVEREIDAFYGRYATAEGIDLATAKKRVSKMDVEAFKDTARKLVKARDFSPEANEALKLYNLTMKINRLEMLKARIGLQMVDGFEQIDKETQDRLFNEAVGDYERQAGILGESVINPEKRAMALVNASFQNATFHDRVWTNQAALRDELASLLQSGLIQGVGSRKLAAKLRKRFDVSKYKAERLLRTEMARVQTGAQVDSLNRNGYSHFVYIARENACPICSPLDGTVVAVKDIRIGVNAPPMHPHCFCSIAAATDEQVDEANMLKSLADPAFDYYGAAQKSNPNEVKKMREEMEREGVEIVEKDSEVYGYAPGIKSGDPGQFLIFKNASYSAWLHEYQHFMDDKEAGWSGFKVIEDIEEVVRREIIAYQKEIDYAEEMKNTELRSKIELLRDRRLKEVRNE